LEHHTVAGLELDPRASGYPHVHKSIQLLGLNRSIWIHVYGPLTIVLNAVGQFSLGRVCAFQIRKSDDVVGQVGGGTLVRDLGCVS
jgi:hypothetical protein